MPTLSFVLTVEEANQVLDALARLPYRDVHELIANFRAQAERQLASPVSPPRSVVDIDAAGRGGSG